MRVRISKSVFVGLATVIIWVTVLVVSFLYNYYRTPSASLRGPRTENKTRTEIWQSFSWYKGQLCVEIGNAAILNYSIYGDPNGITDKAKPSYLELTKKYLFQVDPYLCLHEGRSIRFGVSIYPMSRDYVSYRVVDDIIPTVPEYQDVLTWIRNDEYKNYWYLSQKLGMKIVLPYKLYLEDLPKTLYVTIY
jgi:hypothetical protein